MIKDSISLAQGKNDGYSFCGERKIHLEDASSGEEINLTDNSEITKVGDSIIFNQTN